MVTNIELDVWAKLKLSTRQTISFVAQNVNQSSRRILVFRLIFAANGVEQDQNLILHSKDL